MVLVRTALGAQLRRRRLAQRRTLRDVSGRARVSLGYLSEIERGHKEASSELLASICDALDVELSLILRDTSDDLALAELITSPASPTLRSRLAVAGAEERADGQVPAVVPTASADGGAIPVDCAA